MGALVFSSMRDVLDEYGWTDSTLRQEIRRIWRAMNGEEREVRERKSEREKAKKQAQETDGAEESEE